MQPPVSQRLRSSAVPSTSRQGGKNTYHALEPPAFTLNARDDRKRETDYIQIFHRLYPSAMAGSATAQYQIASALYYCNDKLHVYFTDHSSGAILTLSEAQHSYAKLGDDTLQQITEVYERCHTLFADPKLLQSGGDWLDKAVNAGYPPAKFTKADQLLQANLVKGNTQEIDAARQLALEASTSADASVLFGMANFVVGADKTQEQAAQLISAWWLIACERGYDCGAQSEWIKNNCTSDPQCADKPTVVEELQRMNGAKFGDIQQLADQIGAAVDSHDADEIKKYL